MKKYNSIENISDEFYSKIHTQHPEVANIPFVATVKVDGANFGIAVKDSNITFQSRNKELKDTDSFYDYQKALKTHNLIEKIQQITEYTDFVLFGEIIGDNVQKRIQYSPEPVILFFDLYDNTTQRYLSWKDLRKLCVKYHLPMVCMLRNGSLDEMLAIPVNKIKDSTPAWISGLISITHELNEIPTYENLNQPIEGVVIRPYDTEIMMGDTRLIIKKKADAFMDIRKGKHFESAPKEKTNEFSQYINKNRIISALSKYPENTDAKVIITEVIDDVLKDYLKDNGPVEDFVALKKRVSKLVGSQYASIMKNL